MIRNIGGGRVGNTIELISGNAEFSSNTTGIVTKKNGVAQSMVYRIYDQRRKKCIAEGVSDNNGEFVIANLNPNRDYYVHISDPDGVLNGAVAEWFKPSVVEVSNSAPTISSITPNSGTELGNTDIIIQGNNFEYGASVTFNSNLVDDLTVISTNIISCKTPAGSIGAANVVITNPDSLNVSSSDHFAYTDHIWSPKEIPETSYFDFGSAYNIYNIQYGANTDFVKYDDTKDLLDDNKFLFASNNQSMSIINDVTVGNVLEFNASTHAMFSNFDNYDDIGSDDGDYYMWVVFKARSISSASTSVSGGNRIFCGNDTVGRNGFVLSAKSGNNEVIFFQTDSLGSPEVALPYTLNEWAMIGGGLSANTARAWLNGGLEANTAAGTRGGSAIMVLSFLSGSQFFDGNIRMVGFSKSMPDANTRQKIEGWALHECNLTSLLPADHPYKSVRP